MESGIQSSFIPHDAAVPQTVPGTQRNGGLQELILLVSIVLLVASGALAGAVFLYNQYARSSETSKLDQLKRAKEAFEPSLIQELTRLDDRMTSGQQLLANHLAPTTFFDALQATTLSTVAFQTLEFQLSDQQHMAIKMTGVAQGVNAIALQADLMSKSGVVTNPIFSDISRQQDGVHFSLAALVNPVALSYSRLLSGAAPQGAAVQAPASFGTPQMQQPLAPQATQQAPVQQGTQQIPAQSTQSPFAPAQDNGAQTQ